MVHITDVFLAHADSGAQELHIVGIKQANAAELVLQRHGLALELDPMVAEDVRPHVGLGATCKSGWRNLKTISGSPMGKPSL